jgi:uncharacterized membrane protein YfcA
MEGIPHPILGLVLGLAVGVVLGLLGGGGSILALPIFLYVFLVPTKPAIAMSLAVVGMSAFVGFLSHWRQGTVNLRIAIPFGACAMVGAFLTARVAKHVPEQVQLGLFAVFALTASLLMLRDSLRKPAATTLVEGALVDGEVDDDPDAPPETPLNAPPVAPSAPAAPYVPRFTIALAIQALGVGALTSLIGAGGGFVIVPALVLLAKVPIRAAVGSSLLIITMNSLSGFAGYVGQVPINWGLVGSFTGVAAAGALAGTRASRYVPQARIKQGFAVMILVLGAYLAARKLHLVP